MPGDGSAIFVVSLHDGHVDAHHACCKTPIPATQLELYGKLNKEASKIAVNARNIVLVIAKEEPGFWPRLLRQQGKAPNNVKVDWSKWCALNHIVATDTSINSGVTALASMGMGCHGMCRTQSLRHHTAPPCKQMLTCHLCHRVDEDEEDEKPEFDISDLQDSSNFDLGGELASPGESGQTVASRLTHACACDQ